jgi:pimeloyl-ACP methyl ester carboxylesterase
VLELNHRRGGAGDPLLLIHTLGGSIVMWEPVWELLTAEREVVAVDMPGFGDSPPLPEGVEPSAANLATAVIDFYDSLGIDGDPGVAGISLGAWTAIEVARQRPVSGVVGICSAGFWKDPSAPRRNLARPASKLLGGVAPLLMRSERLRKSVLAGQMRHGERVSPAQAARLIQGYGEAPAYPRANELMCWNLVGDLSGLDAPLTLLWAEYDQVVRNRPLKDGILPPDVRQVELPDCGHVPTWDAPERVAALILEGTVSRTKSVPAQA